MKRLNIILLMLVMLSSSIAFAQNNNSMESSPVQALQTALIKLNNISKTAYSTQNMSSLIDEEIAPLFDFDYIANEVLLVLGNNIDTQKTKFLYAGLKKNIVSTLLARLVQGGYTSFQFISARPIMGGSVVLRLKVNNRSSFGMYIDLLFHQNRNNKWQIFDVVLNNDSLINYYQKMILIKLRRYGFYEMLNRI